jgi:UrcA family protein
MKNANSPKAAVSRRKVTLLMVLCGVVGGMTAQAASAATPADDDLPRLVVRFPADTLGTDSGAKTVYRRLVRAAEEVCPAVSSASPFVNTAVQACRDQAIARAVHQIGSPRLAALHAASSKSG